MSYDITLVPGDGVGPEVTAAATRALEATGIDIRWDVVQMGQATQETMGTPLPESALASIRRNKVALKGPVTTPVGSGFRSANVALRKALDLYACVRPCKTYPGIPSPFKDVDIVVVRENTEDLYSGIEFQEGTPEAAEAIRAHTPDQGRVCQEGLRSQHQGDFRVRPAAGSLDLPSTTPGPTTAARSPRCTRPTS